MHMKCSHPTGSVGRLHVLTHPASPIDQCAIPAGQRAVRATARAARTHACAACFPSLPCPAKEAQSTAISTALKCMHSSREGRNGATGKKSLQLPRAGGAPARPQSAASSAAVLPLPR